MKLYYLHYTSLSAQRVIYNICASSHYIRLSRGKVLILKKAVEKERRPRLYPPFTYGCRHIFQYDGARCRNFPLIHASGKRYLCTLSCAV